MINRSVRKILFNFESIRIRYFRMWMLLIVMMILSVIQCTEHKLTKPYDNLPPETNIFINTTKELNPTQSVQTISWDGRDPDGMVIGFYYTWKEFPDSLDWIFTTEYSQVFPLEIFGTDTLYLFQVSAVDDDSLTDPTPAKQYFPIKNSAPEIRWTLISRIPDTTFTVASFIWDASDLDGDSTIIQFEYALDVPDNWKTAPGYSRILTLNADSGLTAGNHSFYIRAVDVAGAKSEIIRMPEDTTKFWYVKEPKGHYLLIDDHGSESGTYAYPDQYYKNMLNTILPIGEEYDIWNIEELFPLSNMQFIETIKLFDRIIWYTDLVRVTDEHFIAAQVAIPVFLDRGGKIIYIAQFNSGFGSQGDPLGFSPVDSLGQYYDRLAPNSIFNPQPDFQTEFPDAPDFPELKVQNFIFGVIATPPKEGNIVLYRYNDPNLSVHPPFVLLGRNDNTGVYDFVFSGAPLHQMNGNGNLDEFFYIILNRIFDAN